MPKQETIWNQGIRIYDSESHELIKEIDLTGQDIATLCIHGTVINNPEVARLGRRGRRMVGYRVRGIEVGSGKPQTEYEVRAFGRRASRVRIHKGEEVECFGNLGTYLEIGSGADIRQGEFFIIAPNYANFSTVHRENLSRKSSSSISDV